MLIKTPALIRRVYSKAIWTKPLLQKGLKTVYLTFDDGPTPEVTEWVLDQLAENKITATFFCIGKNIEKYPTLFNRIISDGHCAANHTFSHLNGWKTAKSEYFSDIERGNSFYSNKLFRPPYGKITLPQYKFLKNNYVLVFWDVLSYDYRRNLNLNLSLKHIIGNVRDGSIIVFHDSVKAKDNLKYLLPKTISFLMEEGYKFSRL